jgi:hypothetical protein
MTTFMDVKEGDDEFEARLGYIVSSNQPGLYSGPVYGLYVASSKQTNKKEMSLKITL